MLYSNGLPREGKLLRCVAEASPTACPLLLSNTARAAKAYTYYSDQRTPQRGGELTRVPAPCVPAKHCTTGGAPTATSTAVTSPS